MKINKPSTKHAPRSLTPAQLARITGGEGPHYIQNDASPGEFPWQTSGGKP